MKCVRALHPYIFSKRRLTFEARGYLNDDQQIGGARQICIFFIDSKYLSRKFGRPAIANLADAIVLGAGVHC